MIPELTPNDRADSSQPSGGSAAGLESRKARSSGWWLTTDDRAGAGSGDDGVVSEVVV